MQKRSRPTAMEEVNGTKEDGWQQEEFGGDTDFAIATLEGMAAFAEGQETMLLEELRAEIA